MTTQPAPPKPKEVTETKPPETKPPEKKEETKKTAKAKAPPDLITPTPRADPVPEYTPQTNLLMVSPYAWAKLIYMRDRGSSEVSGFGISRSEDDPLFIIDF